MSDRRIQRLAPVVDLATRAERDAARVLGQAQQKLLQSENQLRDLQRYLSDYQQQWLTSGRQGVSGQWMVNYQRFLGQLDTAIEQQGAVSSGTATTCARRVSAGSSATCDWKGCANWCSAIRTRRGG